MRENFWAKPKSSLAILPSIDSIFDEMKNETYFKNI